MMAQPPAPRRWIPRRSWCLPAERRQRVRWPARTAAMRLRWPAPRRGVRGRTPAGRALRRRALPRQPSRPGRCARHASRRRGRRSRDRPAKRGRSGESRSVRNAGVAHQRRRSPAGARGFDGLLPWVGRHREGDTSDAQRQHTPHRQLAPTGRPPATSPHRRHRPRRRRPTPRRPPIPAPAFAPARCPARLRTVRRRRTRAESCARVQARGLREHAGAQAPRQYQRRQHGGHATQREHVGVAGRTLARWSSASR